MSFVQFFRILWARRWIIIASTAGCFLAALIATQILPTRYDAKSRVMMELLKPDTITGQVLGTNFSRAYTSTQIELIRDYRITGTVVDKLGWTGSPELLNQFNATERGPNSDFRRWLSQLISDSTTVKPIEGSNILEITYTSNSAENARVVADTIREAYVEQTLATKREGASGSADWFDGQVRKVRDQLTSAETRKTAFERASGVVIQDDSSDLESTRLRALAGASDAPPPAVVAASTGPSAASMQLAQLDAMIAGEAQQLGPNHPKIQELRRQRGALASSVAQERSAAVSGASGPSVASQVATQSARVIAQRGKADEARRLQADVTVLREQYVKVQQRAAELRQQAESNESGLTLLGSAVTPENPSFPNYPLILFGSIAFGLGLGILAALITELLSRRVRGVEDLAGTGVPVILVMVGPDRPARMTLLERLRPGGQGESQAPALTAEAA